MGADFLCWRRIYFHFLSFAACIKAHNPDAKISIRVHGILYVSNQAEKMPFQPRASTYMESNNSEKSAGVGVVPWRDT